MSSSRHQTLGWSGGSSFIAQSLLLMRAMTTPMAAPIGSPMAIPKPTLCRAAPSATPKQRPKLTPTPMYLLFTKFSVGCAGRLTGFGPREYAWPRARSFSTRLLLACIHENRPVNFSQGLSPRWSEPDPPSSNYGGTGGTEEKILTTEPMIGTRHS